LEKVGVLNVKGLAANRELKRRLYCRLVITTELPGVPVSALIAFMFAMSQ